MQVLLLLLLLRLIFNVLALVGYDTGVACPINLTHLNDWGTSSTSDIASPLSCLVLRFFGAARNLSWNITCAHVVVIH